MCFRVAMVSLHTSPLAFLGRTRDAGGMNVYVRELARELGRGGMYVDIFTRRADPTTPLVSYLDDQVRLITLPAGPVTLLPPSELHPYVGEFTCALSRFAARSRERTGHGYNLLHSHYWLSAAAALPLASAWDVPHVTMFHTVERLKTQQYGALTGVSRASQVRIEHEGRIAASVDAITVSTEHEREQLRRLYGLCGESLRAIPCGVDLDVLTPGNSRERAEAQRRLSPDGQPTLLFVGRLDAIKDIDLLLASLAAMRTPVRLYIVGGNPEGDAEVERLRGVADELGVADRVVFNGAVPQRDLPHYYRGADAVVVPSRYESFGLVAVEALASGTPVVVASAVGGLPSIVRDGENGLLVRWRRPEEFAARLDALVTDAQLHARLSEQARPSVERFAWGRIGDEMRGLYAELSAPARRAIACSCF